MNKFKLTAIAAFSISIFCLLVVSCEKPLDIDRNVFTKTGLPMTGSQVVPANTSAATGTMDVIYVRGEHTLSYTITWSGLSGPPVNITTPPQVAGPAIGLYGPADPGFMSPVAPLQAITTGFPAATSGTYKGSVLVDNVYIREVDLLNNKFYIMIRTAAFPAGQLRGQVDFR